MMAFNDGGPAFPQINIEVVGDNMAVQNFQGGATLWDFYAAAAMNGLIVASANDNTEPHGGQLADDAANYADAMIAEREKRRAQS